MTQSAESTPWHARMTEPKQMVWYQAGGAPHGKSKVLFLSVDTLPLTLTYKYNSTNYNISWYVNFMITWL